MVRIDKLILFRFKKDILRRGRYLSKLYHAVDIEPSAVDIARLRLWLSSVIDDNVNLNANSPLEGNKNPAPLPNLDSNIICANSLVDRFQGKKLFCEHGIVESGAEVIHRNMMVSNYQNLLTALISEQEKHF